MRTFALLMLAAASLAAPFAGADRAIGAPPDSDAARVIPATTTVQVVPNERPQAFEVSCPDGRQVLGGGYFTASRDVRTVSSHPAPSAKGWIVTVWNPTKLPVAVQLEANCVESTSVVVQSARGTAANCPQGTVSTGGGYLAPWTPGTEFVPLVVSSYPGANGWAVKTDLPGSEVQVFALCLADVTVVAVVSQLDVPAGPTNCTPSQIAASICNFPRQAKTAVTCTSGDYAALGYEPILGTLPAFAVLGASSGRLDVDTTTRDDEPLSLRVTALCVVWPEPALSGPIWPYATGAGLLMLAALAMVYRSRSRGGPAAAGMEIVVTSQTGTFRLDRFRETP